MMRPFQAGDVIYRKNPILINAKYRNVAELARHRFIMQVLPAPSGDPADDTVITVCCRPDGTALSSDDLNALRGLVQVDWSALRSQVENMYELKPAIDTSVIYVGV